MHRIKKQVNGNNCSFKVRYKSGVEIIAIIRTLYLHM